MVRIAIIAALAASARAAFIFDAERCNTNFEVAENWATGASPWGAGASAPPEWIRFEGVAGGAYRPIMARVDRGQYTAKGINFPADVGMELKDGAALVFDKTAAGAAASFVAGQEEVPECNLKCKRNYYMGTVGDAFDTPQHIATLPRSTRVPCANDDVIVPKGFNVLMYSWGLTPLNSFTKVHDDGTSTVATSVAELPPFTIYPPTPSLVFGTDAIAHCAASGMLNAARSDCMCVSQCLAALPPAGNDTTTVGEQYVEDIFRTADAIRAEAVEQASLTVRRYGTSRRVMTTSFTFNGIVGGSGPLATVQAAQLPRCLAANPVALQTAIDAFLPNASTTMMARAAYAGAWVGAATGPRGSITVNARFVGPVSTFARFDASGVFNPLATGFPAERADLAQASWNGLLNYLATCPGSGVRPPNIRSAMGWTSYTVDLYVGSNLPQLDLPIYINSLNLNSFLATVQEAIQGSYGVYSVSMDRAPRIVSPAAIHRALHNGTVGEVQSPGYGLSTALIRLRVTYSGFSAVTPGSERHVGLTQLADMAMAFYDPIFAAAGTNPQWPTYSCGAGEYSCMVTELERRVNLTYHNPDLHNIQSSVRDNYISTIRGWAMELMTLQFQGSGAAPNGDLCGPLGQTVSGGACVDPNWHAIMTAAAGVMARDAYQRWLGDANHAPTATPTAAPSMSTTPGPTPAWAYFFPAPTTAAPIMPHTYAPATRAPTTFAPTTAANANVPTTYAPVTAAPTGSLTPTAAHTFAPTTMQPTPAELNGKVYDPNAPGNLASSTTESSDDGFPLLLIIVIAAAAVLIIAAVVLTRRKGGDDQTRDKDVMAFENPIYTDGPDGKDNPVYDDQVGTTGGPPGAQAELTYDEPPGADAAPTEEDMYDEPAMVAPAAAAEPNLGGYLDVEPEEDDDDDDDDDGDEDDDDDDDEDESSDDE